MKKTMALIFLSAMPCLALAQQFAVTSPKGGEHWLSGSAHNITWTFSNIPNNKLVKLMLFKSGTKIGNIAENIPVGANGSGTYNWQHAGAYIGGAAEFGEGYTILIRDMGNLYPLAESPSPFTLYNIPMHMAAAKKAVTTTNQAIHSSGTVTIRQNHTCDLDSGYEGPQISGDCDFWWSQNSIAPYQRVLIPCAGTKFKTLGIWFEYTYSYLRSDAYLFTDSLIPDADLPFNMVVGYLTNQMRSGAFRVVGKGDDGSITVAWVTYD
jgi:hypothetical protein